MSLQSERQLADELSQQSYADIDARLGREEFSKIAAELIALRVLNAAGELTPERTRYLFELADAALMELKVLRAVLEFHQNKSKVVTAHVTTGAAL
jgi:hypothetical protein